MPKSRVYKYFLTIALILMSVGVPGRMADKLLASSDVGM